MPIYKTNWGLNDIVYPDDMNRIENNLKSVDNTIPAIKKSISDLSNNSTPVKDYKNLKLVVDDLEKFKHSSNLVTAIDNRNVLPNQLVTSTIEPFFVILNKLHKNSPSDYGDLLTLNNYFDSSGGKVNALGFSKQSSRIFHFQAPFNSDKWESSRELCYIDHNHDTTYSNINHNHDNKYSNIAHNHDSVYSKNNHEHDNRYSLKTHNHDNNYSNINHNHDKKYSDVNHNHDSVYSKNNHEHDNRYSLKTHNHDTTYSNINHNHDKKYSGTNHNHDNNYSNINHNHDGRYKESLLCVTPNTDGDKAFKWSKLAIIKLKYQYADENIICKIMDYAHGSPYLRTCSLTWRVKQQEPMGKLPQHTIVINEMTGFAAEDFCSIVVHNSTGQTTVELWHKNTRYWSVVKCEVISRSGINQPELNMIMEHPYQDALPLGNKVYGIFSEVNCSNMYVHGNGKIAHIGTGGKDVYFHNSKAETYLQLNDDKTLSFNGHRIFDDSHIYNEWKTLGVDGFNASNCNVECHFMHVGKITILSFCFPTINLNSGMTGQLSFRLPFAVKSWYGMGTNIYRVFLNGRWEENHWYKGQFGSGVSVIDRNTKILLNTQGTGVSNTTKVGVSGIIILERS